MFHVPGDYPYARKIAECIAGLDYERVECLFEGGSLDEVQSAALLSA